MEGKLDKEETVLDGSNEVVGRVYDEAIYTYLASESYETKQGAEKGIESVKKNASDDNRYERKTAKNDEAFFVLKAGNGEPLGRSETYSSVLAMENGIESVKKNAPDAEVVEVD